jgi:hypothetical protein
MARKHPVNAEMDECLLLVPEVIVLHSRLAVALPLQPESADAGKARPCGAMLSGQVKQDELKQRHGMAWQGMAWHGMAWQHLDVARECEVGAA